MLRRRAVEARWATVDDADELVRLRQVMLDAMDVEGDGAWRSVVLAQHRDGIADGRFFAAVVDHPDAAGLVGCGVGMVWERLATPGDDGRIGYIQSMATDRAWRSKGIGRAVLTLLLEGFRDRGVRRVGLHHTADGEPLYRSVGFEAPRFPELRLRL